MTRFEQLELLLAENKGMLQTAEIVALGIPKPTFYQFVRQKQLQQIAHGVYISEDAWVDELYLLHLRCGQGVFSHETALYFHDLTDREPNPYSLTVKQGYNTSRLKANGVLVFSVKEELVQLGATTMQTSFGHDVPVYNMERTICDLIRSRNRMEIHTLQDALKAYVRRKDKNLRLLMQYAEIFRVECITRMYLEILL